MLFYFIFYLRFLKKTSFDLCIALIILNWYRIIQLFNKVSPTNHFTQWKTPQGEATYCTGEFTKRVRETSSQLFDTLYTLSINPYTHKQLRRHLPNPFRKFPCSTIVYHIQTALFLFFIKFSSLPMRIFELPRKCIYQGEIMTFTFFHSLYNYNIDYSH